MNFGEFNDVDWLTFLAGFSVLAVYGALWFVLAERNQGMKRDKALRAYVLNQQGQLVKSKRRQSLKTNTRSFIRVIIEKLNLMKSHHADAIAQRLVLAGLRSKDSLVIYLFCKLVMPIVLGMIAGFVLFVIKPVEFGMMGKVFVAMLAVFIGSKLPDIVVKQLVKKRQLGVMLGVPDALDLMVICAEAGLGLAASLKRVSAEMAAASPEIADEFSLTAAELGFLPERRTALENLARRTDMQQIRSVVNTLLQSEKYGTPLADSLRILADEYRDERMLKAEEKAAKLPATLTVPMVLFILPSLFIVLLAPAIFQTLDSVSGM
ncbi:type II secretion system F family protein [Aestuariispira insulae]|uniref:Tight adherence protein C n=1 Tax=Aestuariispira insulae TaxID=1461337 RepID=A0A3D9HPM7_9PROT|nr:type II secretion system F family protein [Aestuariispira insulae]RED50856.1 tight adherence protein C [Aestuariispira insulae]